MIEKLPFGGGSFDAVLATVMMHHLPEDLKRRGLAEIVRVLRPNGRLVIFDFKRSERSGRPRSLGAGETGIQDLPELLDGAGFARIESEEARFPRLPGMPGAGFVVGRTR